MENNKSIELLKNILVNAPLPDSPKYLNGNIPYASTEEACNILNINIRTIGLTVNILTEEYWWKSGISDEDLIVKFSLKQGEPGLKGATISIKGDQGEPGLPGLSARLYIGYASDNIGTNFSTTDCSLPLVAFKNSTVEIKNITSDVFTGLWQQYKNMPGLPGLSSFLKIGFAADINGTNFSLTDNTLPFISFRNLTSDISDENLNASYFEGKWYQKKGDKGDKGDTGSSDVVYTNLNPTVDKVHGIKKGSTFLNKTMSEMFDALLYENAIQIFDFFLQNSANLIEVGTIIPDNLIFQWNVIQYGNFIDGKIRELTENIIIKDNIILLDMLQSVNYPISNSVPFVKSFQFEKLLDDISSINSEIITLESIYPIYHGKITTEDNIRPDPLTISITNLDNVQKTLIKSDQDISLFFDSTPDDFLFVSVPIISGELIKWFIEDYNQSEIGGDVIKGGNLFPTSNLVYLDSLEGNWNNIPYLLYLTNYTTSVKSITFKH